MKTSSLFGLVFGFILLIVAIHHEPPERHEHIQERYFYANGVKSYTLTYCLTDSVQALHEGKHKRTSESQRYFRQEEK